MTAADDAPGWDALHGALAAGGVDGAPLHWDTGNLPDQDGLYALDAFARDGHWLLVTFGLSELFEMVSDDPAVSGWGFELTFRVPRGDEDAPPPWARELLAKLGAYVFDQGKVFGDGHRLQPGGPITGRENTALEAVAFTTDPEVDGFDGPLGRVELLTVVGITDDELGRMQASSTRAVLDELRETSPLLVTDPARAR